MNIGILGGSFDPPHLGHQLLAYQALDFCKLDRVWLTVDYKHPLYDCVASFENRFAMAKLLVDEKITISDITLKMRGRSFAIDIVKNFQENYPEHTFYWIIGADWVADFDKWKSHLKLPKLVEFLVFPREGFNTENLPKGFTLVSSSHLATCNFSSTEVRYRIRQGLSITPMVFPGVEQYIKYKRLYQKENET